MASDIKTNSILHPAIHAAKRSCLEDEGNAYKKGLLEPWGVIPLTANVKGIRYSFSITPVVFHNDTLPYRRRLEGSPPSGSSPTDSTWPADVPTNVDLTKDTRVNEIISGSGSITKRLGTTYTGRDSDNKPITYTVYDTFIDGGTTFNVKTWGYDGDTYTHQTREEGGELKGEDKTKVGKNVDGSEHDWSERPSNSPILTSYSEIYEEQPNNIRWWFKLDNIETSFDSYINWDETANDSRDLANEVLGEDLQAAVDSYLNDVDNSTKPDHMTQKEWDQNIADIHTAMEDTLNSSKADIGRYLDTLSESEAILNETEDIKADTPAVESVDYVRNGVAYVSDDIATLVDDTVSGSSSYIDISDNTQSLIDASVESIKAGSGDLRNSPMKDTEIETGDNTIDGIFVSYINDFEYISRNGDPDDDTDSTQAFDWGIRQPLSQVFFGNDGSANCPKLKISIINIKGGVPKVGEGVAKPPQRDSIGDGSTEITLDGEELGQEFKAGDLVSGRSHTEGDWEIREYRYNPNQNGSGATVTDWVRTLRDKNGNSTGQETYRETSSVNNGEVTKTREHIDENGTVTHDWEEENSDEEPKDATEESKFVIQLIKRRRLSTGSDVLAIDCDDGDKITYNRGRDDCSCSDLTSETTFSFAAVPGNPFLGEDILLSSGLNDDSFSFVFHTVIENPYIFSNRKNFIEFITGDEDTTNNFAREPLSISSARFIKEDCVGDNIFQHKRLGYCSKCGECCRAEKKYQPDGILVGGAVGKRLVLKKNNIIDGILYCDFVIKESDGTFSCSFMVNQELSQEFKAQYKWFLSECQEFPDPNEEGHCPPFYDHLKTCPNCTFRIIDG